MAVNYVMRPSRLGDLQSLIELAELSGPGFTSLPVDVQILRERLQKSDDASPWAPPSDRVRQVSLDDGRRRDR